MQCKTTAATKFFKKSCLLCGENFHVNNTCPRAGSITEALTNCGVCEAYFDYTNTTPHKALHNLTWNGSVRADTCSAIKWPVLDKTILNNGVSSERMTDQMSSAALQPVMPSIGRLYAREDIPSL